MTVFVGPKRALLGSVKPAFLGASGLWGFTASPTPQYAHFGRATNKAGALASTRNYEAYNLAGTQLFPVNDPVVSAVTGLEGWGSYTGLALHSLAIDNAAWSVNRDANWIIGAGGISPFGVASTRFQRNVTNTTGTFVGQNIAGQNPGGKTYSQDVWIRGTIAASNPVFFYFSDTGANFVTNAVGLVDRRGTYADWTRISVTGAVGTSAPSSTLGFRMGATAATNFIGTDVEVAYSQITETPISYPPIATTTTAATRLADNTTIPDWQAFVERYSLLNGLTIDGTLNIDRLSAANNRTIFQAGSANEFARLDFTTGNRVRMTLRKLGPELRGDGAVGMVGTATPATYDTATGEASATRVDSGNQSFVEFTLAEKTYLVATKNITNGHLIRPTSIATAASVSVAPGTSRADIIMATGGVLVFSAFPSPNTGTFTIDSIREVITTTLESGVVSATGLYDISARFKPGDYALTVSGGVAGDTDASAETLPDAIRTEPAYVGRDIAGSLHWNGNIPSLKIGKAG